MSELIHLEYDIDGLQDLIDTEEYLVVIFTAPEWCAPCRAYKPHYEKVAAESDWMLTWVAYDLHYEADAQIKFNFMSVPTTVVFHKGNEIHRFAGARNALPLINELTIFKG